MKKNKHYSFFLIKATAKKILELRQKLKEKEKIEFETMMVSESREQEKKFVLKKHSLTYLSIQ